MISLSVGILLCQHILFVSGLLHCPLSLAWEFLIYFFGDRLIRAWHLGEFISLAVSNQRDITSRSGIC